MARGLAALQRWLGRAQLWLSSPWDDSGAVFTSAVLLFLVCHDTLACCCSSRAERGAWSRPKRARESRWSTSHRRARFCASLSRAKNNRSSSHRAAAAAQRALLDAARLLGSTLPLHYHHGAAQASHARRVLLRQDADLIDRRRRDRVVEHLPLLGLPAALRRAVLREFIDAALHSAQIMSLTPSTRT